VPHRCGEPGDQDCKRVGREALLLSERFLDPADEEARRPDREPRVERVYLEIPPVRRRRVEEPLEREAPRDDGGGHDRADDAHDGRRAEGHPELRSSRTP
jgi:hypothetical protein